MSLKTLLSGLTTGKKAAADAAEIVEKGVTAVETAETTVSEKLNTMCDKVIALCDKIEADYDASK